MSSQREFINEGEIGNRGLDFIAPVVPVNPCEQASGQYTFNIEGFDGGIVYPSDKEPIRLEDRRLHLVELHEGVPSGIVPDLSSISPKKIVETYYALGFLIAKRNLLGRATYEDMFPAQ